jgi:glycosyltransferase involved in cell wall biosynthesis
MRADRRLRILVVNLGRRGGVTEYGWLMGRALARNAEVAVIYSAFAENREKWSALDCPRLEVPTFAGIWSLFLSFLAFPRFARMRRFAQQFRPDVIYYPGGHVWKPLLDVLLPRSAATVLTVHDPHLHPGEDSLAWRLLGWTNRRRVTGYVLLNRVHQADYVARYGLDPKRVIVIPIGVLDDYSSAPGEASVITALTGISASDVGRYLLFIGRIRPYKGVGTLLEAYGMLAPGEAGPLVIAGSGDLSETEKERLRALEGRPVYFVNAWLADSDVGALVSAARFVVLPYLSATQTGVVPLASAFGIPAIASATDGLVEQVVDGRTGLLFPPGDPEALRGILAEAYAIGDEDYTRMSRQCREYAFTNWGWEGLSSRLVRFCESLSA